MAPIVGVQDASNQTDVPDTEDQEPPPPVDACVKQEQNLNPCQLQNSTNLSTSTTNLTNLTNFEIVAGSPEKMCNVVRITTATTTINPTACGIVGKVDKAENTIINMADCPKYSITKECRSVTSVDRTIEHVVTRQIENRDRGNVDDENQDSFTEDRLLCNDIRNGPRIIEITEENCDSFHENLEFFGRRRDHSLERHRDRKRNHSAESTAEQEQKGNDTKTVERNEVTKYIFFVSFLYNLK